MMLLSRILNFLKKDKRYVIYRLSQELFVRLNKFRYRFLNWIPTEKTNPEFKFFNKCDLSTITHFASVVKAADEICDNKFDLLGSGPVLLKLINWSEDFKSGFIWEKKYFHDYAYNDLHLANDVKVPWELSRFQYLPNLAQAHILTKDEKYLSKIKWFLEDWDLNNPFANSINWACTMDVALRAISITLTLDMLKANGIDTLTFRKFDRLLTLHGYFISENLERSDINGNHYLADIVGLYFSGLYFAKDSWKKKAILELEKEISNQILDDGSDFEASIPYHRLVLELFYLAYRLDLQNGKNLSRNYYMKLQKMFEFVSVYIKPDGSIPIVGDNDNGRAFILGTENLNDHRYLLEIGQSEMPNAQILNLNVSTDYCSWLGINPATKAKEFQLEWASENYVVIKNSRDYLFVEMSPIGLAGRGGHGHSDTGSFELMLSGVSIFIDSGCYSYTSDYERRNKFRSSQAHNIIQIDGNELFPLIHERNLWNLKDTIKFKNISLNETEVILNHDGYGCDYERSISLNKKCVIRDVLKNFNSLNNLASRFHLHPEAVAKVISNEKVLITHEGKNFEFIVKKGGEFTLNIEPCEISFHFGKLLNSSLINVSASLVGLDSIELEYELKEVECSKQS